MESEGGWIVGGEGGWMRGLEGGKVFSLFVQIPLRYYYITSNWIPCATRTRRV